MRYYIVLTTCVLILIAAFWFGSQPPSDEAIMAIYYEHHVSLTQLVQLYQEDQVGVIVHKNGSIFPDEATQQLSSERLSHYKALVKEIGMTRSLGGGAEGIVTLQIFNPIPFSPIKTLIYSPTSPPLITSENTDDYAFTPGQYQYVCRLIENSWYLCLDKED